MQKPTFTVITDYRNASLQRSDNENQPGDLSRLFARTDLGLPPFSKASGVSLCTDHLLTPDDLNQIPPLSSGWVKTSDGTRIWYRNGKIHRSHAPAVIAADGTRIWMKNDLIHRGDGPAVHRPNGTWMWCLLGERHRDEGPAVRLADGSLHWYRYGERHRDDGPAIVRPDGTTEWYVYGNPDRLNGTATGANEWRRGDMPAHATGLRPLPKPSL